MGEIVSFELAKEEKLRHSRDSAADELDHLAELARAGQIRGACYVMLTADGERTLTGFMKGEACGMHELVGASSLLHDYILRATLEE